MHTYYICMYTYIYIHIHTHLYVYVIYTHIHMHMCNNTLNSVQIDNTQDCSLEHTPPTMPSYCTRSTRIPIHLYPDDKTS